MLPLVSNALPPTPNLTAPSATASSAVSSAATGSNAPAAKPILNTAVASTPATAAYFPGTAPARQTVTPKDMQRIAVPPPTGDYILVEVPPAPQPPPPPVRLQGPVTLGIPQTTQLAAQALAQQPAIAAEMREAEPAPAPKEAPRSKENFARAKGATAYGIAAARSAAIGTKPEIDAA